MSNPLVSIVTPVYNCEKFIESSMMSIWFQSFKDYEHIVCNDGGTDGTIDIAKTFISDKITVIDDPVNKKIPARRNSMIKDIARGKYIAIHDGDDESLPDRLQKQVEFLEKNPDIFCVGSHAIKMNELGEDVGVMDYPPASFPDILSMIHGKCMNPIIDPSTVFRRETFLKLGGYSEEKAIYTVPDFDLWLRAISSGSVFANIPEYLIRYRSNSNGMTNKHKSEMISAHMVVWSRYMAKHLKNKRFETIADAHLERIVSNRRQS